jgi:hypothetical protein
MRNKSCEKANPTTTEAINDDEGETTKQEVGVGNKRSTNEAFDETNKMRAGGSVREWYRQGAW